MVARLLRDPFEAIAAPTAAISSRLKERAGIVFSLLGNKLFARAPGGLLSFPIPNSPRSPLGRPRFQGVKGTVLGVSVSNRRTVVLTALPATRALMLGPVGDVPRSAGHFTSEKLVHAPWKPEETDPLRRLLHYRREGEERVAVVDARGWLFEFGKRPGRPWLLARDVLATTAFRGGMAYLAQSVPTPKDRTPRWQINLALAGRVATSDLPKELTPMVATTSELTDSRAVTAMKSAHIFARFNSGATTSDCWMAVRRGVDLWALGRFAFAGRAEHVADVPVALGCTVIGLSEGASPHVPPRLLVVDPGWREVHLLAAGGPRRPLATSSSIETVAVDDAGQNVAVLTSSEQIEVSNVRRSETVARFPFRRSG
jgi:hypothetical protein